MLAPESIIWFIESNQADAPGAPVWVAQIGGVGFGRPDRGRQNIQGPNFPGTDFQDERLPSKGSMPVSGNGPAIRSFRWGRNNRRPQ
jgi:hypothetical protein